MYVLRRLQIDEPLVAADPSIPQELRAKSQPDAPPIDLDSRPLGDPQQPGKELAPGVVFIPGSWNGTLVRQDDGIVILEAPISSGYTGKSSPRLVAAAQCAGHMSMKGEGRRFPTGQFNRVRTVGARVHADHP
jgi:hypothetical protein